MSPPITDSDLLVSSSVVDVSDITTDWFAGVWFLRTLKTFDLPVPGAVLCTTIIRFKWNDAGKMLLLFVSVLAQLEVLPIGAPKRSAVPVVLLVKAAIKMLSSHE